jgi:hypothetical protein
MSLARRVLAIAPRRVAMLATAAGALLGLAPAAAACPYCSLSQGVDTLVYIMAFLLLPYLIVSGVWVWLKRLLASEREGPA